MACLAHRRDVSGSFIRVATLSEGSSRSEDPDESGESPEGFRDSDNLVMLPEESERPYPFKESDTPKN